LGSSDGTQEDLQGSSKDHGGRTHPRLGCSTISHKGGRTKRIPKVRKTVIAMRTMKMKRSNQIQSTSPPNN